MKPPSDWMLLLLALRSLAYYLAIGVAIGTVIGLLLAWVRQMAG